MVEVREVLRGWLDGVGLRTVAARARVDRKTARRYVEAARTAGLARGAGVEGLSDELVGWWLARSGRLARTGTATETNDFYELVVERHRKASTIVTSNREPSEWLTMMSDALLAQSAVDRLTSGAHTLIIEGPSYRQRSRPSQRVTVDSPSQARNAH